MKTDDPRFTAHALGEHEGLTPGEIAEIQALIDADTIAAEEAAETRSLAARLREELRAEEGEPLTAAQRDRVLAAQAAAKRATAAGTTPARRTWIFSAAAACAIVALCGWVIRFATKREHSVPALTASGVTSSEFPTNAVPGGIVPPLVTDPQPAYSTAEGVLIKDGRVSLAKMESAPPATTVNSVTFANASPAKGPAETIPGLPDSMLVHEGNGLGSQGKIEAVTPTFVAAAGHIELGRYDLADANYKEVLKLDPKNAAALKGREEVANLKDQSARAGYDATRSIAQWKVDKEWARPYRRTDRHEIVNSAAGTLTLSGAARNADGLEVSRSANSIASVGGTVTFSGVMSPADRSGGVATGLPPNTVARAKSHWAMAPSETNRSAYGINVDFESGPGAFPDGTHPAAGNANAFEAVADNPFLAVRENPLSTFSTDVDTASYAIVRRFLNQQQRPPKEAVRIEEMLNYFSYDYPQPKGDAPFSATMEVAACPWTPAHRLVRIGLKAAKSRGTAAREQPRLSHRCLPGSMQPANRLPLAEAEPRPAHRPARRGGPRGHGRLCRREQLRAGVHQRQGGDAAGARAARGRRLHEWRRGHPARLRDREEELHEGRREPRDPRHGRRLECRHHEPRGAVRPHRRTRRRAASSSPRSASAWAT